MSPVRIRRATAEDWRAIRDIRLYALREAPLAFASTFERESSFTEDIWRSRASTASQFLAVDESDDVHRGAGRGAAGEVAAGGDVLGTATGYRDPADPETLGLVAMFVRPEVRGRGIAGLLVDAVVAEARALHLARVALYVVETNAAARRAYERRGFRPTGVTCPLPHAPELTEHQLALVVA